MTSSQSGQHIVESNQALRTWAAGLRTWSRAARATSSSERLRARRLVAMAAALPVREATRGVAIASSRAMTEPVLPSLDDVRVDELVAVLVGRHHFRAVGAVRAMRIALLMAGYPPESDAVLAADALDVLDNALHYPD